MGEGGAAVVGQGLQPGVHRLGGGAEDVVLCGIKAAAAVNDADEVAAVTDELPVHIGAARGAVGGLVLGDDRVPDSDGADVVEYTTPRLGGVLSHRGVEETHRRVIEKATATCYRGIAAERDAVQVVLPSVEEDPATDQGPIAGNGAPGQPQVEVDEDAAPELSRV